MFRTTAAIMIIFFTLPAFSIDAREERWNLRIDKLKKIQQEISTGKPENSAVKEITSEGIKSAEEFITILNRYKNDDGTLKHETKKYSLTEIEGLVKEISLPVISLFYISGLYKFAENIQIKDAISRSIIQYAAEKSSVTFKISAAEALLLAEYYIIEKGISEFQSSADGLVNDIRTKTVYEMSRNGYSSNDSDIRKTIQKKTEESISGKNFFNDVSFNEDHLKQIPLWKFIYEKNRNIEARNTAAAEFVYSNNSALSDGNKVWSIKTAEEEVFGKAKSRLSDMIQNTTPGSGARGNNPYYEIPDLRKLGIAIDEIDKYRKNLVLKITGSENSELVEKLKNNNRGIAARSINRIESQFRGEEMRIERLKKTRGDLIILNEELFKTSKDHFAELKKEAYGYADLSARFLEAVYSRGKNDPDKYIELFRYRSERNLLYMSFYDKITAGTVKLSESGAEDLRALYRGLISKVLNSSKSLLTPEPIPSEVRETFKSAHLNEYASINADYRIKGSQLIINIRKNYDDCISGFSSSSAQKKESSILSEGRIGQDETDRLFLFAKKCSEAVDSMKYTETSFKKYRDEFVRISEDLKKGKTVPGFTDGPAPEFFHTAVTGFIPENISRETAARELLSAAGMEALSGSLTLVQHYRRKGAAINFTPTNEEIILIKKALSRSPQITVSSWKMNPGNFRTIDMNITTEIKKLINKNSWKNVVKDAPRQTLSINESGIDVSFTPPAGWEKLPAAESKEKQKISFKSPDLKGIIEVISIRKDQHGIQELAGLWPKKSGYAMIEKNWGKKSESDYIKSTSKNSYNGIMELYLMESGDRVIILSGKSTGDMHKLLNKALSEMFQNLEIREKSA